MFCKNCGTGLSDGAKFCAACGAAVHAAVPAAPASKPAPARAASPDTAANAPLKKGIMEYLMLPAAVILILIGIGHMALAVAGRPVTAQVTGCERALILNNDDSTRNPNRYKLEYRFSANGEQYTGSVTRVFEGGSQMRKTLPVRYLPFWPHVNAEDGAGMGLVGPAAAGLGVLVLALAVRKKSPRRNAA
ncbi:MAG TPA: zinc-ribbon domain-containing protein [Oscillospiraceae bacterium]|nr:zinc-ribbon domain-containing protein [Oscillospiraceae bacterium]HNW03843.1 zinc-ribbon domain-containing protein [Oscillospiraceae bacterium]HPW00219.1 zinc-ribbon domain-containing protein [Oscillospiraceae bacterium]